jgi:hypothetical protein
MEEKAFFRIDTTQPPVECYDPKTRKFHKEYTYVVNENITESKIAAQDFFARLRDEKIIK